MIRFFKYSNDDVLKLKPILYKGKFLNSIPFISFYDNKSKIFRTRIDSKWGKLIYQMIKGYEVHDKFTIKCISSIELEKDFFLILPIKSHLELKKINLEKSSKYLHINNGNNLIVSYDYPPNFKKIKDYSNDIDSWIGKYDNSEEILNFFKKNYEDLYFKYIQNEREFKLNYLFDK